MKMYILAISTALASLSLTGFGILNWNSEHPTVNHTSAIHSACYVDTPESILGELLSTDPYTDFFYDFGPRFSSISKSELNEITLASEFLTIPEDEEVSIDGHVSVIIMVDDVRTDTRENGSTNQLTDGQLKLLRNADYSTNFVVSTNFKTTNTQTGEVDYKIATPHLTVVPEKQASYSEGKEALLKFFKTENMENTLYLDENKVNAAKLSFTVSKSGEILNSSLDRSVGSKKIDKTMMKLLRELPGTWIPAENTKGEKVDQVLVISFGVVGC